MATSLRRPNPRKVEPPSDCGVMYVSLAFTERMNESCDPISWSAVKVSVFDGTIHDYQTRVDSWCSLTGWCRELPRLKASAKVDAGSPVSFPGLSLFATTQAVDLRCFARLRDLILSRISGKHYPVDDDALHLTIADLVAGDRYLEALEHDGNVDRKVAERVTSVFREIGPLSKALKWRVAGVAFLKHAVACVLEPLSASDYHSITRLRAHLYQDRGLAGCGVVVPRPFLAHITLAYFDVLPPVEERLTWLAYFEELQLAAKSSCAEIGVTGAILCEFESMADFNSVCPLVSLSLCQM
ncbi:MAG: hypothetical protein ACPGQS_11585 [Bradymonadia bacterium]